MNGFTCKVITSFVLIATALLASTVFATTPASQTDKYHSAGCMACHQGDPVQLDKQAKKHRHHKPQTVQTSI